MKKDVLVLGLGNPLMSDEGIGSYLIEKFIFQADKYPLAEFLDAGTGGMSILHLIADRRKVILIDCAYMGTRAGTIRKFGLDEVKSVKKLAHYSLHEVDILKVLDLSMQLGQCPHEVTIFGIEPESVNQGQCLSETLAARIPDYVTDISRELAF